MNYNLNKKVSLVWDHPPYQHGEHLPVDVIHYCNVRRQNGTQNFITSTMLKIN